MRKSLLILVLLMSEIHIESLPTKIAIVVSMHQEAVAERLLKGATEHLSKSGIPLEDINIATVPSLLQIPFAVQLLANTKQFEAIICLGWLAESRLEGVSYADLVAENVTHISLALGIPIICCFDSREHTESDQGDNNKGWSAASDTINMLNLAKQIKQLEKI